MASMRNGSPTTANGSSFCQGGVSETEVTIRSTRLFSHRFSVLSQSLNSSVFVCCHFCVCSNTSSRRRLALNSTNSNGRIVSPPNPALKRTNSRAVSFAGNDTGHWLVKSAIASSELSSVSPASVVLETISSSWSLVAILTSSSHCSCATTARSSERTTSNSSTTSPFCFPRVHTWYSLLEPGK